MSSPRRIVVVVPAHDERERLPACLASLAAAAPHVPCPVHVVVVLDDCTDGTADVVPPTVATVTIAARSVGVARATGFSVAASGAGRDTWLATTDADSTVPSSWLANHVEHYRSGADAVLGTVSVHWREHSRTTQRRYDTRYGRAVAGRAGHGHVHGANLGVRADRYWQVGGFRELPLGEDVDLVDRLVGSGVRIAWDVDHPVHTSDRRQARARGGFGDYVCRLADERAAL